MPLIPLRRRRRLVEVVTPDDPVIGLGKRVFKQIQLGSKTAHLTLYSNAFQNLSSGDYVAFTSQGHQIKVRVLSVFRYDSLNSALQAEDVEDIDPGSSVEAVRKLMSRVFDLKSLNCEFLVFHFEVVSV